MRKLFQFLKSCCDEAHEQAAIALFITAICLEIYTDFDDYATVGILFLACVTLLGYQRYGKFKISRDEISYND